MTTSRNCSRLQRAIHMVVRSLPVVLGVMAMSFGVAVAEQRTLTVTGGERSYVLLGGEAGKPKPLILALHGNSGTGAGFATYARWDKLASAHGVAVALPDGLNRAWNDGRPAAEFLGRRPVDGIDDVKFLSALVEHLVATGIADKQQVFVTGISNGGMMTYRMLCDRADLFVAGAAVIATLSERADGHCHPSRRLPLLIMNGTEDRVVSYAGTPGRFMSTDRTAAFWGKLNGCTETAERRTLPHRAGGNGTTVERIDFACPKELPVVIYRVEGGGHQMPSFSESITFEAILGPRNRDIDGAEEIWSFFSRFIAR